MDSLTKAIIINPGSGPVRAATEEQATENIAVFAEDVAGEWRGPTGPEDEGRWPYVIFRDGREIDVEMPGIGLQQVRYLGRDDQNIWDFPRLYVDGGSWVWEFGVRVATRTLNGEDDDDE